MRGGVPPRPTHLRLVLEFLVIGPNTDGARVDIDDQEPSDDASEYVPRDEFDELEQRVSWLEADTSDTEPERHSATRFETRDPGGSTGENTVPETDTAAVATAGPDFAALASEYDLDRPARRAVEAIYEYVDEHGQVGKSELQEQVYPEHSLGLSSEKWWYEKLVLKCLKDAGIVEGNQSGMVWVSD